MRFIFLYIIFSVLIIEIGNLSASTTVSKNIAEISLHVGKSASATALLIGSLVILEKLAYKIFNIQKGGKIKITPIELFGLLGGSISSLIALSSFSIGGVAKLVEKGIVSPQQVSAGIFATSLIPTLFFALRWSKYEKLYANQEKVTKPGSIAVIRSHEYTQTLTTQKNNFRKWFGIFAGLSAILGAGTYMTK